MEINRFKLPTAETQFGLPVGKHLKIHAPNPIGKVVGEWNGRADPDVGKAEVQRSYTPTSSDDDLGYFNLLIKVYRGGARPEFVDGGKISQFIDSLTIGDHLEISGPFGLIEYKGRGSFTINSKSSMRNHIGMIAGGTGITPMYQVIKAILKDDQDTTSMSLLFANQTEDDILLRGELEHLASENPGRFKVWYTLDRPTEGWGYSRGFINEDMIREHLPPPNEADTLILMCGPPPMIDRACKPSLEKLGFTKPQIAVF